jgi:uncharacterized protein (TIGR03067 family)
MKMRWMVVGTLAVLVVAGQLLARKEKPKQEAPKVMKFKFISFKNAGKETPKKDLEDMTLTVTGDKGVVKKGDKVVASATSKVDMTKKPWTIDLKMTSGEEKGKTLLGIMKMKDGTMTICFAKPGADRPTEFSSTKDNEHILEVLEEVK